MKQTAKYLLLFFVTMTAILVDAQQKHYRKHVITLQIISPKDTFILGQPMLFIARITNVNKRDILVPDSFCLTSNLSPNGLEGDENVSTIHCQIWDDTLTDWASSIIENIVTKPPKNLQILRPGASKDFYIDIGKHILSYNAMINNKIQADKSEQLFNPGRYKIKLSYYDDYLPKGKILKQPLEAESQKIIFFLSK